MNFIKYVLLLVTCLFSFNTFAGGGSFTCFSESLAEGENVFVQGMVNGELTILESYLMVDGGDDNSSGIDITDISVDIESFELKLNTLPSPNLVLPIQKIWIKAKGKGAMVGAKIVADFEITYDYSVVKKATGECCVNFVAGI